MNIILCPLTNGSLTGVRAWSTISRPLYHCQLRPFNNRVKMRKRSSHVQPCVVKFVYFIHYCFSVLDDYHLNGPSGTLFSHLAVLSSPTILRAILLVLPSFRSLLELLIIIETCLPNKLIHQQTN